MNICIGGITGWAGGALAQGVIDHPDLNLVSGISRSSAGKTTLGVPTFGTIEEALEMQCDVYVEYTKPEVAKHNIIFALNSGQHVVVGTSGLTNEDYTEIHERALVVNRGVLAAGNFAMTAVLLMKFSEMAARYLPTWEVIDYASQAKRDVPSGTVRELVHRMANVKKPAYEVDINDIQGPKEARGADLEGTRVHSIRQPGHVLGVESVFGKDNERLSIRHDAGNGAEPYVGGALLAIEKVASFTGLRRGLDAVMEF